MKFASFLLALLFFSVSCTAQSDLLILKKNNKTVKTFFPGTEVMFSTAYRSYYGDTYVDSIMRDTVFIIQYDIKQMPTNLGVYYLDTIGRYRSAIDYKDITGFGKNSKKFDWSASGATLFGGGTLLTAVGLGTWIFAKPNTRYYARPAFVITSAALGGIGYLLLKAHNKDMKVGKKYKLTYIKVK